ncbi:MAG: hypothetical protein DRI39_05375 [Chloroflexi bacterium]|nr:MAG: hypothetical protein DRI39_05375 [Chloroflexota bacterium]RLC95421.1 MAG: hypothetical protein DRI40_05910 [Chloroflexota bacterium]
MAIQPKELPTVTKAALESFGVEPLDLEIRSFRKWRNYWVVSVTYGKDKWFRRVAATVVFDADTGEAKEFRETSKPDSRR